MAEHIHSPSVSGKTPNSALKEHMHPRVHGRVPTFAEIRKQRPPSCLTREGFSYLHGVHLYAP